MLGYTWSTDGRPIAEEDVRLELYRVLARMKALDLIEAERDVQLRQDVWRPGPSALSLLPDVLGLAAYLAHQEL